MKFLFACIVFSLLPFIVQSQLIDADVQIDTYESLDSLEMDSSDSDPLFQSIDTLHTEYNFFESAINQRPEYGFLLLNVLRGIRAGYTVDQKWSFGLGYENFEHYNFSTGYFVKSKYMIAGNDRFRLAGSGLLWTENLVLKDYFGMLQLIGTYGDKNANMSIGVSSSLDKNLNQQYFFHFASIIGFNEGTSFISDNFMDQDGSLSSTIMLRMVSNSIIFDIGIFTDLKGSPVPLVAATLGF